MTLVIVGMTLLLVMEGLSSSRTTAAHASNRKVAMGLALLMIGRVESGLFWEDLDGQPGTLSGSFAEEGYEAFQWELVVGSDELSEYDEEESPYFDSFRYRRQVERERREDADETEAYAETGSTGGPYEIVKVRVTFPKLADEENEVTVQRTIPLRQVFGYEDGRVPEDAGFGEEGSS